MLLKLFALFTLLTTAHALAHNSPTLAGPVGVHCADKKDYSGGRRGVGRNVTIGGVPTYVSDPPPREGGPDQIKKVITFYSDVYSPWNSSNELVQDYFASQGFYVLGIDYFFGDRLDAHTNEPGFDFDAWIAKSVQQADEAVPRWLEAVKDMHGRGPNVKYSAVGYCFGAPYSMRAGAGDDIVATAFAHPAFLTEEHFTNLTKPLLLSCAEYDYTFSNEALRRANDILAEQNSTYHLQIFSGVVHGFATRADPNDENAVWALEESGRSIVEWFNRFSK